jgi:hypothetical protein
MPARSSRLRERSAVVASMGSAFAVIPTGTGRAKGRAREKVFVTRAPRLEWDNGELHSVAAVKEG